MYKYESMSKFLSFLLRHHPEYLELKMDKAGWVAVDELLEKLNFLPKLTLKMKKY